MKLTADINACKIDGWQSNTGEVNARTLDVEMCEQLCSCVAQFVVFTFEDGTKFVSKVKDNKAEIPPFEKSQFVTIGLYGSDVDGKTCKLRYSPKPAKVFVDAGSYTSEGEEATFVTIGTLEEIIAKAEGAGGIEHAESVDLATAEDGLYFTERLNYPVGNGMYETLMSGTYALLYIASELYSKKHFIWFRPDEIYEGYLRGDKKTVIYPSAITNDNARKFVSAKAVYDYVIAKEKIVKEVDVSVTFTEDEIYNANAVNNVLVMVSEMVEEMTEKIEMLEKQIKGGAE